MRRSMAALLAGVAFFVPRSATTQPVDVRHREGLVHGFLALRTLEGETIAGGDLIQTTRGDRVTSRMLFHFKDGSLHDETAIFSQSGRFRLLSYHLVQKGPTFPHPMEVALDGHSGQATVRYTDDGKENVENERVEVKPELANGMVAVLLKNVKPGGPPLTLRVLAATPKPRMVKLVITPSGEEDFTTAASGRKATHYVIKIEIGGISGVIAPLVGKEPPDQHVWILHGPAPAFVRSEGPLYVGGPAWRIELTSPAWPKAETREAKR